MELRVVEYPTMPRREFLNLYDRSTDRRIVLTGYKSGTERMLGIVTTTRGLFGETSELLYEPVHYQKIRDGLEEFNALLPKWRGMVLKERIKQVVIPNDKVTPSTLTLFMDKQGTITFDIGQDERHAGYAPSSVPRILAGVKNATAWLN